MKPRIHICGAGFSGLTLAKELNSKGFPVIIYDENPKSGGLISSIRTDLCLMETAANGLLLSGQVKKLFQDLQLDFVTTKKESKRRFIWVRGRARRFPVRILSLARHLPRFLFLWVWNRKALKPFERESLTNWGIRIFGKDFTHSLLEPAMLGIYAGDPARMSANLMLGHRFQATNKENKTHGTVAPLGGMGELIAKLQHDLELKGVKFQFNTSVQPKKNEVWVQAIPASKVPNLHPEMIPLISANLVFRSPKNDVKGFGCLFARGEGFRALGVLSNHNIFPNRGPAASEKWIYGGATDTEILKKSDAEIIDLANLEREKYYGRFEKPDETHVIRWESALPHYTLDWQKEVKTINQGPEVYYTGNYLGHLGLAKILQHNQSLAEIIERTHGQKSPDPQ